MIKVSIIVPVYKVEAYLNRCIDSLINQTLKEIEIILVNDGSPDNCPQICDDYVKRDSRIKVIHKKNEGLGFARNSGLQIANGEFVAFVDSDDFVDINMYEVLYNTAKLNKLDTVFCNCSYNRDSVIKERNEVDKLTIFEGKKEIRQFLLDMIGPEPSYKNNVKYLMSVWRAIYSNELLKQERIKFCSEREFISEDIIFHIDYLPKSDKVGFVPEHFYFYCYNENSLTKDISSEKSDKQVILLQEIRLRLSRVFEEDIFLNNYIRLVLARTFTILRGDYISCQKSGTSAFKKIKARVSESLWQNIFVSYPYTDLPLKHKIFYLPLRYKWVRLIQLQVIILRYIWKLFKQM